MNKSTYKVITSDSSPDYIQKTDAEGKVWSIPMVEANSDYAEYLASLEATEPEAE
jgi:hypothetical protein